MFAGGSSGFYKAPVSKALILLCGSTSALQLLLKKEHRDVFTYNISHILQQSQLWRLLTSHLLVFEFHTLVLVLLLVYSFRIFERRYGSRKFASHLLATSILSSSLNVSALCLLHWLGYEIPKVHSGILGTVAGLFVPMFMEIPNISLDIRPGNVPLMQLLTSKMLVYLIGAQLAASSACAPVQFLTGILAGILYRANFLGVKSYIVVPKLLATWTNKLLSFVFESRPPRTDPYPMGATLDIQRQIRADYVEQRWLLLQARQNRQARIGQRRQFAPFNFFQRQQQRPLPPTPFQFTPRAEVNGNQFGGTNHNPNAPSTSGLPPPVVVSEERVQQLVDMGFNSSDVRSALQASNNDISLATNILLRE